MYLVNKEYRNKPLFLFEPCLTNKVRLKNISAVLQVMAMMPYSAQIDIRHTKFSPVFLFSLGLQYNFVVKKNPDRNHEGVFNYCLRICFKCLFLSGAWS